MIKTLTTLCQTPAVSGCEQRAAEMVEELLAPYCQSVSHDVFGNVFGYVPCGVPDAKTVLLDAHLDQIGFVVTEVLDGGFLRFAPVGGVDPRMLLGCEVTILTEKPLYGVISCTPPHLLAAGEQNKAVPIHEMLIDTGLLDARESISVGTQIMFAESLSKLGGDSVVSKCLDDRAGIAVLLQTLDKLQGEALAVNIIVMVSVQEEETGLGALVGTYRIRPDYAIAVDVGHAKTPDAPSDKTFEYGGGVMIGMGPNLHTGLTKLLIKTAKAEEIPFQQEVMEGHTGTNAWQMQIAALGTAMGLLSIPLRYMHTPIEAVKLSDLETVSELLTQFLRRFNGEVRL